MEYSIISPALSFLMKHLVIGQHQKAPNPKIRKDKVSTIKIKNKNYVFYLSEGIENCKMSGKSLGILR